MGLRDLSELQWEVTARAWSRNLRIWKRSRERMAKTLGFLFRKHGPKCLRPVVRFLWALPQNSTRRVKF